MKRQHDRASGDITVAIDACDVFLLRSDNTLQAAHLLLYLHEALTPRCASSAVLQVYTMSLDLTGVLTLLTLRGWLPAGECSQDRL